MIRRPIDARMMTAGCVLAVVLVALLVAVTIEALEMIGA